MIACYGWAEGNSSLAARHYRELYGYRDRFPTGRVIEAAIRRAHEGDALPRPGVNGGRVITRRTAEREEEVLRALEADPCTSSRVVGRLVGMCHCTVNQITRAENLRPFHLNPVQELRDNDVVIRVGFSQWFVDECNRDEDFTNKLLVADESNFTQSGVRNCHNDHRYAEINPHATRVRSHRIRYSTNLWSGIIGTYLVSTKLQLFSTLQQHADLNI